MSRSLPEFLQTPRLRLFPCSLPLTRAAVAGPAAIRRLLKVDVADGWPGDKVGGFFLTYAGLLEADAAWLGWGIWLVVHAEDATIIGDIGFKGPPDRDGEVEIGYSVVPGYRRRGYATEAARAMVAWGVQQAGVTKVRAECYRDNPASIGVLKNVGLVIVAEDADILRWETPSTAPGVSGKLGPSR